MNLIVSTLGGAFAFFAALFRGEPLSAGHALSAAYVVLAAAAVGLVICLICHKWVRVMTIGAVFLLAFLLYLPLIAQSEPDDSRLVEIVRAATQAFKLFFIECAFELLGGIKSVVYERFLLALFAVAPLTTAITILSYFHGVIEGVRFFNGCCTNRLYVFSELNEKSLALAEDIRAKKHFVTIVFHDVYRKEDEKHVEFTEKAEKLRAICFRGDILHLKAGLYRRRVEFFVIGENESENLDHAIRLTKKYGKRRNTAVYVWARNPESACILDSFRDVPPLDDPEKDLFKPLGFRLRRIDDVETFVWNTLREADLFRNADGTLKERISILIVGMGDYGMEFLKTAVWMYQCEGVQLEITALDIGAGAEKRLRHDCPELLPGNESPEKDEAQYSLRFLEHVDIFADDLENMLFEEEEPQKYSKLAERLRRTDTVFVTLGDDDRNIRAALELRKLFDRVHFPELLAQAERVCAGNPGKAVGKKLQEISCDSAFPAIYTSVYDVVKTENITLQNVEGGKTRGLRTYENTPFHIVFKGSFREQYSYENVTREKLEEHAFAYHLKWAAYEMPAKKADERIKYEQFEYYRHSSMAQALHKEMVTTCFGDALACRETKKTEVPEQPETVEDKACQLKEEEDCTCIGCMKSKRIEHMRWNAYMRSIGYRHPEADRDYKIKLPRAKMHYDLVAFKNLHQEEKAKDSTIRPTTKSDTKN